MRSLRGGKSRQAPIDRVEDTAFKNQTYIKKSVTNFCLMTVITLTHLGAQVVYIVR